MRQHSWVLRPVATLLVPAQILLSVPVYAGGKDRKPAPSPPPKVRVNRTVPKVAPPPAEPVFSAAPTDAEIFRARVFEEPLVPIGAASTVAENQALAKALLAYLRAGKAEDASPLEAFLRDRPRSAWRASLLADLGLAYRRTGYFTKALAAWDQAWRLSKDETEPKARAIGDRAVAGLAELDARLGRFETLEALLGEIEGRDVRGSAAQKIAGARQGLWLMRNKPGEAFRCGPLALDRILASTRADYRLDPKIAAAQSTTRGTSLSQMRDLAQAVGLKMQMAYRAKDGEILFPALVHWKAGHFAALVKRSNDRYLMQDPTFGDEMWVSREALDEEGTGYFLVPEGNLPPGWRSVGEKEAEGIWGSGAPYTRDPRQIKPTSAMALGLGGQGGPGGSCPMATYNVHAMLVSLNITDAPLGYSPPRGPAVSFLVRYNQRDSFQPQTFFYSNLGPQWTFDWLSYLEDDPSNPAGTMNLYVRGGGQESYTGYDAATQSYAPELESRAVVVRTAASPIRYERRLPDGSVEVFAQADGAASFPRKIFMTQSRDAQGNALAFTYDASLRLVAATDAIGQVTTLSYDLPEDPLKITKVTDPFGRFASFDYEAGGHLIKITDLIGITSEFGYGVGDFIQSLTTPYGTTTFAMQENPQNRWLQITDPLGGTERVEFLNDTSPSPVIPAAEPASAVPTGFTNHNQELQRNNTFYWDKLAWARYPGDYSKAKVTHWLKTVNPAVNSGIKASEKLPLENRVWYAYPGQTVPPLSLGTLALPSQVARVVDDGTSQIYQYSYNSKGQQTQQIDPLGRETVYEYDTNEIDLLRIKQKNPNAPGGYDVVGGFGYNGQHQRLTATDTAGQTMTYSYTPSGQIQTVTTPPRAGITEQRTTTYSYDPTTGDLLSVAGPGGVTSSQTYDGYGRLRTTTDSANYTVTYDYDALDRLTRTTYPDGTYEEIAYRRLDPETLRDRLGRTTHTFYDALRRVGATRDPAGRTVTQKWSTCGASCGGTGSGGGLEKLIDANGNATTWERDVRGRVTKEIRANGSFKQFVYENTTSRLKKVIDAKLQETQYSYGLDGKLLQTQYLNAEHPTPDVSLSYTDPATGALDAHGRLRQLLDGTGTTAYSYHPIGQIGGGQLAAVDGPLADDTVAYGYDELGSVVSRTLNGVTSTWSHDQQGRLVSQADPIGTFTYAYVGNTGRPQTVTYPNGQTTSYAYFPVSQELRLQEIHHKKPGGVTLNKFNYTYDVVGDILTWAQQTDTSPAQTYTFEYDRADQLTAATLAAATPRRYRYAYDKAGNRTSEQIDDAVTGASYDNTNRLTSQQPGGALLFSGSVSELATVTVQGKPALVAPDGSFSAQVQLAPGTNTVTVVATDASGNVKTNTYQVSVPGATTSYSYDANGNLASDGTRTFEWDAENRLVAVNQGTLRSEFTYDGAGKRVRIVEKNNSVVTADRRFVFEGIAPVEERDASGAVVKRFFANGFQQGGVTFFWVEDHLGSVRDVTDSAGTLRARYDYDLWGRKTKLSGDVDADFGFTGHFFHATSTLHLAPRRGYDAAVARWISRDPSKSQGNLYAYVGNNPIIFSDPYGLEKIPFTVTTVIRKGGQAGIKTKHTVYVDTDSGAKGPEFTYVGDTKLAGGTFTPLPSQLTLNASSAGGKGCIVVHFVGRAKSAIGVHLGYINYGLTIYYNANKGAGLVTGTHDGYPSYEVYKRDQKIYDFPEGSIFALMGNGDISVNEPF